MVSVLMSIPSYSNILKRKLCGTGIWASFVPTQLGIVLVQGYLRIDPDLVLPRVRSAIEEQCTLLLRARKTRVKL